MTNRPDSKRPLLRVVAGGRGRTAQIGSVIVQAGPAEWRSEPYMAVVEEQDTFLVMKRESEIIAPREHMIRTMTNAMEVEPQKPGSIIVRQGKPLRLLAITNDFNQSPSCRPLWVAAALNNMLDTVFQHNISSLVMPPLGRTAKAVDLAEFVNLLQQAFGSVRQPLLKKLWLEVEPPEAVEIQKILRV